MSDDHGFSSKRVFYTLFILTAVEVAWGMLLHGQPRLILWGGLMACAIWKGALIFMYFMHMKFEGWIVKVLIAPTLPLMAVVVFALMPDVANNKRTEYNVADQLDETTGEVIEIGLSDDAHGDSHGEESGGH